MRGDSGVAGEGRVVGTPKFHSSGECSMPLTNIKSDWMPNASSGLRIILCYLYIMYLRGSCCILGCNKHVIHLHISKVFGSHKCKRLSWAHGQHVPVFFFCLHLRESCLMASEILYDLNLVRKSIQNSWVSRSNNQLIPRMTSENSFPLVTWSSSSTWTEVGSWWGRLFRFQDPSSRR